jgi:serine/threonine-protein kinase
MQERESTSLADIGSVLGGRYRLVELLGQGGMATVYRGQDSQLGRDVTVKVLRPEYGRDPDFLARFRAEAQAVASLNDPNVVSVFDFGQDTAGPFIVMEYVDGEDLATLLRRNGALAPRQAARIARDVARALEAAHEHGIVHRDVKPANVLIANDGRVKVTDFGIARAVSEAQLTLPGTTLGSVHYLSPEQVRGEPASASSDIFGLGIVLYEMLTGRRPWEGESAASVAMARLSGPGAGPSDVIASVPPALDAIDRKALAPIPSDRFLTAGAMAEALQGYLVATSSPAPGVGAAALAGGAGAAGVVGGGSVPGGRPGEAIPYARDAYAAPVPPRPAPAPAPAESGGGTSPWVWISGIAGLLILVVAGFLIFRLVAGGSPPAPQQVTVPDFVGQAFTAAQTTAQGLGIQVILAASQPAGDRPAGTILSQDPAAGGSVDKGGQVKVTVATSPETVAVPDLKNKTEAAAVTAIVSAGLVPGTPTERYDPAVPSGSVVGQSPAAGIQVAKGTSVDYVLSKGPEPTASPSPTPTPTPVVTPEPSVTVPPTAAPLAVGDYRCLTLDQATQQMTAEGFTLGSVSTDPVGGAYDQTWLVKAQVPNRGELVPVGTPIRVTVISPAQACP